MANRVNTKFVIILATAIVVFCVAIAGAWFVAIRGRAERDVAKADALMQLGKFEDAEKLYARSVNKDQTRQDWIEKWIVSLTSKTPAVRPEYEQAYDHYRNAVRQLAVLRSSDVEAQVRYLEEVDRNVRETSNTRAGLEHLIREVDNRAQGISENDPERPRLLRYRAIATVDQMSLTSVDEQFRTQARAELESAIAADPKDWQASLGVVRWYLAEADRGLREGRPELIESNHLEASRAIAEFLVAHPNHPEGMLLSFLIKQGDFARKGLTTPEDIQAANEELKNEAARVIAAALATPQDELRVDHVSRLAGLLYRGGGSENLQALLEVVDRTLAAHLTDAELLMTRGVLIMESGKSQEAIASLQRVVDLPDVPVSLDGLLLPGRRQSAVALQIDASLRVWEAALRDQNDAAAREALATAKRYRNTLSDLVGVRGREVVLIRDAKIAMAEERYAEAVQHLSELRRTNAGQSIEVLQLLAQCLERQQNLGEARRVLLELVQRSPNIAWAHAKLGEMNVRLGNLEQGLDSFSSAAKLEPQNTQYVDRVRSVRTAIASRDAAGSASAPGTAAPAAEDRDVVVGAIVGARRLTVARDYEGALATLQQAMDQNPEEPRLIAELAQTLFAAGRKPEAVNVLEDAVAAHPENTQFEQMLIFAKSDDPEAARIQIIESSDATDLEKALQKFELLIRSGKKERAMQELASAERIAPNDARVIDFLFVVALNDGNRERYVELAKRAAEHNVDQMNGLVYQARIEMIEGRDRDAVQTLERAVKINEFLPSVRRLLAHAYAKVGRAKDSLDAYQRAYEGKPDDLATARDYAIALVGANRGPEALDVVSPTKGVLRFHPSDEEANRIWLTLEGRHGNREVVLIARREKFAKDPADLDNSLSLVGLLIDDEQFAAAEEALGVMEAGGGLDPLAGAALRANLLTKKGDVEAGVALLQAFVDSSPESDRTIEMYQTLGEFLIQNNLHAEAAAVLEIGRKYQDPKLMQADRRLGDLAFDRGSIIVNNRVSAENAKDAETVEKYTAAERETYELALKSYQAVLAANPDELVTKRAAETCLRLERPLDAEKLLEPLIKSEPDGQQMLALRAEIAKQKGEARQARDLLNRAVELYPSDASPFVQRALFLESQPGMLNDALEDLTQAVRLRPSLTSAWLSRVSMLKRNNRTEEGIAVMRQAAEANPTNEQMRMMLVRELWGAGKQDLAQAEVLKFVSERPDDVEWLMGAAYFMKQVNRFREAGDIYQQCFDKKPEPETAGLLLDARMRSGDMPPKRDVQKYLAEFEKGESKFVGDFMLRARARSYLLQEEQAKQMALEALALVKDDPAAAKFFADELMSTMGTADKVVDFLEGQQKRQQLHALLRVSLVAAKSATGTSPGELVPMLAAIEPDATDTYTKFELYKLKGQMAYLASEFRICADAYAKAIEFAPNNVQLNNDLAYTLASELNDPAAALPYAEKAASLNKSSQVLDTLGWVQAQLKQYEAAEKTLTEAVAAARAPDQSLIALLHLGLVQVELGNRDGALRSMLEAEKAARATPAAAELFKEPLEKLRKATE